MTNTAESAIPAETIAGHAARAASRSSATYVCDKIPVIPAGPVTSSDADCTPATGMTRGSGPSVFARTTSTRPASVSVACASASMALSRVSARIASARPPRAAVIAASKPGVTVMLSATSPRIPRRPVTESRPSFDSNADDRAETRAARASRSRSRVCRVSRSASTDDCNSRTRASAVVTAVSSSVLIPPGLSSISDSADSASVCRIAAASRALSLRNSSPCALATRERARSTRPSSDARSRSC
ncbi:unannotated protein [freshwater metagenome]|uniref:Unannotated protein n=1 Tax=freshwater metagenome TaxID=449393 RepID=A0A6J6BWJ0_9ZZZZ